MKIENCELKIKLMSIHIPVLLKEVIENLNLKLGDVVVDVTLGSGGHARLVREHIGERGIIIGIDLDIKSIENFAEFPISNFQFPNNFKIPIFKIKNNYLVNGNFSNLENILQAVKIKKVDAILADLGWSSDQLEGRGMSFRREEDLDMRLDRNQKFDAKKVVNEFSEEELGKIIKDYGEEKFWKNIARRIVLYRKNKKIETTSELADIVKLAIPHKFRYGRISPTTKTFQALRIIVNNELENLEKFIPQAVNSLAPGGRLAIITFHSLEDRIVKNKFRENARGRIFQNELTGQEIVETLPEMKIITKKPIVADESEVAANPRSRSAKLRVSEKIQI